eukprot:jgi/Chlat1/6680/Chrsp49S00479
MAALATASACTGVRAATVSGRGLHVSAAGGVARSAAAGPLPRYAGLRSASRAPLLAGSPAAAPLLLSGRLLRSAAAASPSQFNANTARKLVTQAVATSPAETTPVARELHGFEEVETQFITEYNADCTLYRHKKTGAELMSVKTDDENKVFGIVFRTPPSDSTGIPHILEHSVLCGSRKYPIKEPFVELIKGSLNTFLNAFTYPDRTCYPVASTNLQDFYNLIDVYLDAVFHPRCISDELVFQQEGWHYELEDPKEPLTFKGVVFNEMKGVYSQPDSVLGREIQQKLFPDNTYGVDSGGDPRVIPNLTFEQFKDFHAKFYHPSNARIWVYGDDDATERLRILDGYLSEFEANEKARQESIVGSQPLFKEPKRYVEKYGVGEEADVDKKTYLTVNWVLSEGRLDLETDLALSFLNHLMLGTSASPLHKALMDSGLGEAVVGGGLETELAQPTFSIGMKGVAPEDVAKLEALVMDKLKELAEESFSDEAVEASINTIEFYLRENNTGRFPRGLALMLSSMGQWLYGGSPFDALKFEEPLKHLKGRIASEGAKAVFSPLINQYLLDNTHRVTLELQPDTKLGAEIENEEKERLESVRSGLKEDDIHSVIEATRLLKEKQETPDPPEALATVPALVLEDIPKEAKTIPIDVRDKAGAHVISHDLFTNDVLYVDVAFDMRPVPKRLMPLVPLFCRCLIEMGTDKLSFIELTQKIGQKTGGISASPFASPVRKRPEEPALYMMLRGKAMAGQAASMFDLMREIMLNARLDDKERFKQMVLESKASKEGRMLGSGHSVAATRLDAMDSRAGYVSELMGGLSSFDYIKELANKIDSDWDSVQAGLEEIRTCLLSRKGLLVNLTADEKTLTAVDGDVAAFMESLPDTHVEPAPWEDILSRRNEALIVPTQVNYVGKAANLYNAGYELDGSAYVISKHVGATWLWDRVRVSGGAYGGFCDFDSNSGVFSYLSYRDPNLLKTLDNYDGTPEFLRGLELSKDALTKAIIGCIGDVDSYQLPDAKGYTSFMRYVLGVTDEERQQRREQILSTTQEDFHKFADALEVVRGEQANIVAVASADAAAAANNQRPGLLVTKNVL